MDGETDVLLVNKKKIEKRDNMRKRDPFLFLCTLRTIASKGNGAVEAARQQHRLREEEKRKGGAQAQSFALQRGHLPSRSARLRTV